MRHQTVGVIGGSGFIGSHLANALVAAGKQVRIATRRRSHASHLTLLPLDVIELDVFNPVELARFVARGKLAIPEPTGRDPNEAVYRDAANRARRFGVDVVLVPSPGEVRRGEEIIPASYMNFYIGNAAVVVPQYGAANDEAAVAAIQALFPGRVAVGLRADHILTGGGSFHCISQQEPA